MKHLKPVFYFLFIISLLVISCNDDNYNNEAITINNDGNVINKRLYFSSKESFQDEYYSLTKKSEDEIEKYFTELYEKDFLSLRPYSTEENENMLYNLIKKEYNSESSNGTGDLQLKNSAGGDIMDDIDDLEDIIGDDAFGAFLNYNAEIQIGDNIYKYTDVGLFISKENKYSQLVTFLTNKEISNSLITPTSEIAKDNFINTDGSISGSLQYIYGNDDIQYFRPNESNIDPNSGSGSSTTISNGFDDLAFNNFVSNLGVCDASSGFISFLGDNYNCKDRYENKRRVKTKAYNQDFWLVYAVGVKVKHQKKGLLGLWRREAVDEIRLGAESIQFQYDYSAVINHPTINTSNSTKNYYQNNNMYNYSVANTTYNNFVTFSFTQSQLPQIFQDDLTIEFFGTGWPWLDTQIQNGLDSSLTANKFNEYFYDGLYGYVKSEMRSAQNNNNYTPPTNRTFVAKFPEMGKYIVQKSVYKRQQNVSRLEKVFDWGAEVKVNLNVNDANNGFSISGGAGSTLIRPKNMKVKLVGAVKRNGVWHGSKLEKGF